MNFQSSSEFIMFSGASVEETRNEDDMDADDADEAALLDDH